MLREGAAFDTVSDAAMLPASDSGFEVGKFQAAS